ncbi:VOC family protein [Bacillus sp. SD088]
MGITPKSTYLTIPVSNYERSIEWYGEHLGFKVIIRDLLSSYSATAF